MPAATVRPMIPDSIRQQITALFPRYPEKRAVTLPALHLVLEHFRCVPLQACVEIAEMLGIEPAEVQDTMTFYGFFPQAPMGDVRLWVCRSISCALRGGDEVLDKVCHKMHVHPGETTQDGKVTVEFAECLGICDHGPAALADDGRIYGPLESDKVIDQMIADVSKGPKKP